MASPLLLALISTLLISAASLAGVVTLSIKDELLHKILFLLVGFSAGALLGGAFLHLLPEALATLAAFKTFSFLLGGFVLFFLLEKILKWRHCHDEHCDIHAFTYLSLVGDAIHNFIDGLVIMASFLASTSIGITTTLAIILHEIPQEIGDFGILLYGGFSKTKALCYNLLSALTAVLGAVVGFFLSGSFDPAILLPIAAGGFIYVAASDLIPELHKEPDKKKSILSFVTFLFGLGLMLVFVLLE